VKYIPFPAKRQSAPDHFNFSANKGSIEQKGSNVNSGVVGETVTRTFHPKGNSWNGVRGFLTFSEIDGGSYKQMGS